jgi:hypothetical protein
MNRITWKFTRVVMLAMIAITGHACIKERSGECIPLTRVYFTFDEGDSHGNAGTIRQLDLYAFDADDRFVGHWVDEQVSMSSEYYMDLDGLVPGTYCLVAWANLSRYYATDSLSDARREGRETRQVSVVLPEERQLRGVTLPHLYFGDYRDVTVARQKENRYVMRLEDNLYKFNFKVEGINPDEAAYAFVVTDNNGSYAFDNSYKEMDAFEYVSPARFDDAACLAASMTVLRVDEGRKPTLSFNNETTGQRLFFTDNLVGLILQANQQGAGIDFRVTHEFEIVLRVYADARVAVVINGWEIQSDNVQVS